MMKKNGFTLIEFLVVFAIIAMVGGITSDLFLGILRGSNKANITNEIKQNGSYALSFMERTVRNSAALIALENPDGKKLVLQDQEEAKCIRFEIEPQPVDNSRNGSISVTAALACRFSGSDFDEEGTFSGYTSRFLTNTDTKNGVSVTEGNFVVSNPIGSPATVSISFTLSQGVKAPSRSEYKAAETFQTLISLRTY